MEGGTHIGFLDMDYAAIGAHELGLPVFQALVEPSGGYVIPHETFTTNHLSQNLEFLLNETFLSKSKRDNADSTVNVAATSNSAQLEGCMVDMRIAG